MSVQITEKDLQEAYAEIEVIKKSKHVYRFSDELLDFITNVTGDLRSRGTERMSFAEVYEFITNKGWADFVSPEAMRQAYKREFALRRGGKK